ncbi:MAG: SDR family NAD(P)-dependent oxidoreductase [Gammaproteobacteria bacterium]|nr:SDR family NAD(P)-dependent oxidoreductase [Gammaproteobacteria bacterium]
MDLGLTGRTALITGGSKGIGVAAAESLAQAGCNVHLASRTLADLEAAQTRLSQKYGVNVDIHPVDLSDGDAARALIEGCKDVEILVNNAGAIPAGDIHDVSEERWREAWDLKVFGYQNTCRAMLAHMRERGRGVIVNVVGAAGEAPTPGYIAGSAGNASIMAMTRALGATSRSYGVRVVGINPGLIATDRMVTLLKTKAEAELDDAERWRDLLDQVYPPGMPEHIGDMVAFLASDRSANTTGTIITIDGGSSARGTSL